MRESLQLSQTQSLQQRLAPQQVQFLKLLQLPLLALEQNIKAELEQNPMLEDVDDIEIAAETEPQTTQEAQENEPPEPTEGATEPEHEPATEVSEGYDDAPEYLQDEIGGYKTYESPQEEREDNPAPSVITLTESLLEQISLLGLEPADQVVAEEIIGSLDTDGYLRRALSEIVSDLNTSITAMPEQPASRIAPDPGNGEFEFPVNGAVGTQDSLLQGEVSGFAPAPLFSIQQAERVLHRIQRIDPVGIGARTLQECLIVQLLAEPMRSHAQDLALRLLQDCFEDFLRKHYLQMVKRLATSEEALRSALEEIQKLNPKPGNTAYGIGEQTVIPDFLVERTDKDLLIMLNDHSIPQIRISRQYQQMLEKGRATRLPRDARTFLRQKYDAAKSFVTALQQRRITMMKTMRAIAELQREFFFEGEQALRPLFYRHVAERIGVDVSTVCRVVNGKYVQCDWGVFELKFFFNDAITREVGDEVANRVIKSSIREMIQEEDKRSPLSDDEIARRLNAQGFRIARRTVAKYREQQQIPVARLRKNFS
jgi:RNA polymerase sigma-54 factor